MDIVTSSSGLTLCFEGADEKEIDARLRALDSDSPLFLDKERDPATGAIYYVVKQWIGEGFTPPAITLTEWREPDGRPRPLNHGLVEKVRSMHISLFHAEHGWGASPVQVAFEENERLRARASREIAEAQDEIIRDFDKHGRIGSRTILPRSPGLRASRDKRRARGEIV